MPLYSPLEIIVEICMKQKYSRKEKSGLKVTAYNNNYAEGSECSSYKGPDSHCGKPLRTRARNVKSYSLERMRTRKIRLARSRQIARILMLSNSILDRRRATLGAMNTCRLIRVLSNSRVSLVGVDGENVRVSVCVCVGGGGGGGGGGGIWSI